MGIEKMRNRHDMLSLMIAAIAVLLSQFPPVYKMFYSSDIKIRKENSFVVIPNMYRGLSVSKYYSITNLGKDYGRINGIFLFISNDINDVVYKTRAQAFMLPGLGQFFDTKWDRFTELVLSHDENWSHLVSFGHLLSPSGLEWARKIGDDIKYEEEIWRDEMEYEGYDFDKDYEEIPLFKISDDLLIEVESKIKKNVSWMVEGDYNLFEIAIMDNGYEFTQYKFSINSYHIKMFIDSLKDFAYGDSPVGLPSVQFRISKIKKPSIPTTVQEMIDPLLE